jgi:hypothetical protein
MAELEIRATVDIEAAGSNAPFMLAGTEAISRYGAIYGFLDPQPGSMGALHFGSTVDRMAGLSSVLSTGYGSTSQFVSAVPDKHQFVAATIDAPSRPINSRISQTKQGFAVLNVASRTRFACFAALERPLTGSANLEDFRKLFGTANVSVTLQAELDVQARTPTIDVRELQRSKLGLPPLGEVVLQTGMGDELLDGQQLVPNVTHILMVTVIGNNLRGYTYSFRASFENDLDDPNVAPVIEKSYGLQVTSGMSLYAGPYPKSTVRGMEEEIILQAPIVPSDTVGIRTARKLWFACDARDDLGEKHRLAHGTFEVIPGGGI